ncbi:proprotein convertase subtilisin/kexin type 6-like [Branchiostoma floridae]|uniref:Proprotein convertase subtilisin/kexin type 6-like n=1 Tax=Branchiostoma floridae TaxID=7739 RepID=A0A9J7MMY8_BRAFL|nr:proprotein convertase subtilisin/kexin type 6-like [Branchiostoma floridae]
MAAGVFALLLSANDRLSVRDVQHLVTRTSRNSGICGQTWKENSAGFRVSDYCGFGLLDAGELTAVATNWSCVPEQVSCIVRSDGTRTSIPQRGEVHTSITVQDSCVVNYLEHVFLTVRITFPHRGHLRIRLTSPGGTISDIVPGRATDMEPDLEWTFMTLHHWGESAVGPWRLSVQNTHPHLSSTGDLETWSLRLLGTETDPSRSGTGICNTQSLDSDNIECTTNPCQNGGICTESIPTGYKCHCRSGYTGDNCAIGCHIQYPNFPADNFAIYDNRCHWLSTDTKGIRYPAAKEFCESRAGRLITVKTSAKQNWLTDFINKNGDSKVQLYWIGLDDRQRENHFMWSDGTTFNGNQQPRNNRNRRDCVHVNVDGSFDWAVVPCKRFRNFVCEMVTEVQTRE